jgi:hypothetical protein
MVILNLIKNSLVFTINFFIRFHIGPIHSLANIIIITIIVIIILIVIIITIIIIVIDVIFSTRTIISKLNLIILNFDRKVYPLVYYSMV